MKRHIGRGLFSLVAIFSAGALASCGGSAGTSTIFELLIENISTESSFTSQSGTPLVVLFSGGAGAIHLDPAPIFTTGEPARANGLETLAEDGNAQDLGQALQEVENVSLAFLATLAIQENAAGGVLGPEQTFRVILSAESVNSRLSFALGFIQANDLFVATGEAGVPLFDEAGNPRTADITGDFALYDAGTEVNQAPGEGPDQVVMQMELNQGAEEGGVVRLVDDGFTYPAVGDVLRITIKPIAELN